MDARQPHASKVNIPGVEKSTDVAVPSPAEVRIRCIEHTYIVENSSTLHSDAHAKRNFPPRASHPVPYSVAIADGIAQFAPAEAPRCAFVEYVPAVHNCGGKSVATVRTFAGGMQRACARHALASHRFGLEVTPDAGDVVAE